MRSHIARGRVIHCKTKTYECCGGLWAKRDEVEFDILSKWVKAGGSFVKAGIFLTERVNED